MGELLKYGGSGMVYLLEQFSSVRKPVLGNGERDLLFKKGEYRGSGYIEASFYLVLQVRRFV